MLALERGDLCVRKIILPRSSAGAPDRRASLATATKTHHTSLARLGRCTCEGILNNLEPESVRETFRWSAVISSFPQVDALANEQIVQIVVVKPDS